MVKLLWETCQVGLEELSGCLDGVLYEDQVLCEGRGRETAKREKLRVRKRLLELDRKMGREREKRAIRSVR